MSYASSHSLANLEGMVNDHLKSVSEAFQYVFSYNLRVQDIFLIFFNSGGLVCVLSQHRKILLAVEKSD